MLTSLLDRRLTGRSFGGYRLEKVLGAGRFATCFLARKQAEDAGPVLGSDEIPGASAQASSFSGALQGNGPACVGEGPVVMKLVKPQCGRIRMDAVWAECSALQACSHPAIPEWLGIVNMDKPASKRFADKRFALRPAGPFRPYFIVQSYMPGDSLAYWLKTRGHVFGMDEIRAIGLQLIDALEHLEQRGIVHGDLRPANILYDGQRVSLVDFGLSFSVSASLLSPGSEPASMPAPAFTTAANPDSAGSSTDALFADRDGLASILLFLLYSDKSRIRLGIKATWREELRLPLNFQVFLERLFSTNQQGWTFAHIREDFLQLFPE